MTTIRPIRREDLEAIAREPYSVTIGEPGNDVARLAELFDAAGFWQEHHGAVAIDHDGLRGTLQFFRSRPCIHGDEIGYVVHDQADWGKGFANAGLSLLTARLFTERPAIHRLQLTIECSNTASWKVGRTLRLRTRRRAAPRRFRRPAA